MKKIKALLKTLPIIAILLISGCSSAAKETSNSTDNHGNETTKIRLGIEAGITTPSVSRSGGTRVFPRLWS